MTTKPILFSGPMVRALLDGRKTQTRRIVRDVPDKPPGQCHPKNTARHPEPYLDAYCGERRTPTNPRGMGRAWHWWQVDDRPGPMAFRLPCAPGDLLWVRETWAPLDACTHADPGTAALTARGFYRADYPVDCGDVSRWRPSIHMPRWASRLTLRVTDVRVQRVQEISEKDAIAEGCRPFFDAANPDKVPCPNGGTMDMSPLKGPVDDFRNLWDSLNAKRGYGWDENPWVAAYTFEVIRQNVDDVTA